MGNRASEGRIVVVTGVGHRAGIGFAIARRLLEDGARVLLHSFSTGEIERSESADAGSTEALLAELGGTSERLQHIEADLGDRSLGTPGGHRPDRRLAHLRRLRLDDRSGDRCRGWIPPPGRSELSMSGTEWTSDEARVQRYLGLALLESWLRGADARGVREPRALALATADAAGRLIEH
jgi:hypothetical protein